jgi:hypothetical protein
MSGSSRSDASPDHLPFVSLLGLVGTCRVFTAAAGDAAVAGYVGANTRIVDWLGRRVIPG